MSFTRASLVVNCQPAGQRYKNAYLSGAICPVRGTGAALALPYAGTFAMQLHLDGISRHAAKGAHAVLLPDRAGWHPAAKLRMPKNITPVFLPSRAPGCRRVASDANEPTPEPNNPAPEQRVFDSGFRPAAGA